MIPLSERMRPSRFSEIIGHESLVGKEGFLTKVVESGKPLSLLFYGPPGSGKTSMARLYASSFPYRHFILSAVSSGIADIKKILKDAKETPLLSPQTILFLDEIHRFNKAQQDIFLPFLEDGSLILVGATTENPSFAINNALLSRMRVFTLPPLKEEEMSQIISRFEEKMKRAPLPEESRKFLLSLCQKDARHLLNLLENIERASPPSLDVHSLGKLLQKSAALYDKKGDGHYNLISALHKSVRGSDPDAALYWLARMLASGEDPLYLARRMIRMASEDIGLAEPYALDMALKGYHAYEILGSPEGDLALAEVAVYLALSPKSNALYTALKEASSSAEETRNLPPPPTILNAPTPFMKELGYGKDYQYDHDTKEGFSGQHYFPEGMERKSFYTPVERGFEREMKKRLAYFSQLREKLTE